MTSIASFSGDRANRGWVGGALWCTGGVYPISPYSHYGETSTMITREHGPLKSQNTENFDTVGKGEV